LCYATIAVVANPAAGRSDREISLAEIESVLKTGMGKVRTLLESVIPLAVDKLL
jgi:purine nucleoside phosphorylase